MIVLASLAAAWLPDTALLEANQLHTLYYADANFKIFHDTPLPPEPPHHAITLLGARGEAIPFQIVASVREQLDDTELAIACPPHLSIEVLQVSYTNLSYVVNKQNRTGLYADPLPNASAPVTVPAFTQAAWWVTLTIGNGTSVPRGLNATLTLQSSGAAVSRAVPIEVRVWDFALPLDRTQLLDAQFSSGRNFNGTTLSNVLATDPAVTDLYYDKVLRDNSQGRYQLNRQVWQRVRAAPVLKFTAADFSAAEL